MANNTLYFKDTIGSYENFISTPQALYVKEHTDPIIIFDGKDTKNVTFAAWSLEVYNLLYRKYMNWEIAFINIDDCLNELWNIIDNHIINYLSRKSFYKYIVEMKESDILNLGDTISNFVEYNNTALSGDPLANPLKEVTNQNSSRSFADKLIRFKSQIHNLQFTLKEDFLGKFKGLFLTIFSLPNYWG